MKKSLSIILLILIILTIALPIYAQDDINNVEAKVVKNNGTEEISEDNKQTKKVQNITVRILEGEYENEEYEMVYIIAEDIQNSIVSNIELKEDDNILVSIEEKDGEVTNVNYVHNINSNYMLYIVGAILIILLLTIGIRTGIMLIIIYLITIILTTLLLVFSMKMGWNLILVSGILSFVITVFYISRANRMNKKTFIMITGSVLSITFAGLLMYILFDFMRLSNINVKITENFVNIKDLICSCIIVVSCGLCNLIILVKLNIESFFNKPYKTKSDNIIEGQRSLKL